MKEPALGMIEFKSVAKGIIASDAMAKKATIKILETHPICPGKYMVLICGEVAEVDEALKAGIEAGQDMIVNHLFLPHLHKSVIPAMTGTSEISKFGAIGVIETFSIASCIVAADIAAKATPVELAEIRLAMGLGGKAYFIMTGELYNVEASLEAAKKHVKNEGLLAGCEIIPAPHPDIISKGVYW